MIFTVTIDMNEKGELLTWCQEKEKMTDRQREKFEAIKKAVDKLIRPDTVRQAELLG